MSLLIVPFSRFPQVLSSHTCPTSRTSAATSTSVCWQSTKPLCLCSLEWNVWSLGESDPNHMTDRRLDSNCLLYFLTAENVFGYFRSKHQETVKLGMNIAGDWRGDKCVFAAVEHGRDKHSCCGPFFAHGRLKDLLWRASVTRVYESTNACRTEEGLGWRLWCRTLPKTCTEERMVSVVSIFCVFCFVSGRCNRPSDEQQDWRVRFVHIWCWVLFTMTTGHSTDTHARLLLWWKMVRDLPRGRGLFQDGAQQKKNASVESEVRGSRRGMCWVSTDLASDQEPLIFVTREAVINYYKTKNVQNLSPTCGTLAYWDNVISTCSQEFLNASEILKLCCVWAF